MYIEEMIYEDSKTLQVLLSFLHSQQDQVRRVIFDTQEEYFHFLPGDPRDGSERFIGTLSHVMSTAGLGLMYRVIQAKSLFQILKNHNFNGQSCRVLFILKDDFLPENHTRLFVHFVNGRPCIEEDEQADVEVSMEIAEFSSLLMGTVTFSALYRYGLAAISNTNYLQEVNLLFTVSEQPKCTVRF